jgi:GT2 family glycosyltransferase
MNADRSVDLSICMVSLDCWPVLKPCLDSLVAGEASVRFEVIIVDNASTDGTPEKLRAHYPWVQLIENSRNTGFTKATNQGIRASRGCLVLWLNCDTLLRRDSLTQLVRFLDQHPSVGIVGPKVLNADGSFQPQCRRGMPTPFAALAYLLRLDNRLPDSPGASQYLLRHRPIDDECEVDSVSGCCLLARRSVWDQIGPLDEDIFGFGEDIDWCVRAKNSGWSVWYVPSSVITHLKGQGGVHAKPYHKVKGIHQAMWVFFRKHLRRRYPPPVTALVWLGIRLSLVANLAATFLLRTTAQVATRVRHRGPATSLPSDPASTTAP